MERVDYSKKRNRSEKYMIYLDPIEKEEWRLAATQKGYKSLCQFIRDCVNGVIYE